MGVREGRRAGRRSRCGISEVDDGDGRLRLTGASSASSSFKSSCTSCTSPSRSLLHPSWDARPSLMRVDSTRARASSAVSAIGSAVRIVEREDWVAMDDWRRALDISRACTLRSRSESRCESDCAPALLRPRVYGERRRGVPRRGETLWDGWRGVGRKRICWLSDSSVSASASSALSGYSGGWSEGTSSPLWCLGAQWAGGDV